MLFQDASDINQKKTQHDLTMNPSDSWGCVCVCNKCILTERLHHASLILIRQCRQLNIKRDSVGSIDWGVAVERFASRCIAAFRRWVRWYIATETLKRDPFHMARMFADFILQTESQMWNLARTFKSMYLSEWGGVYEKRYVVVCPLFLTLTPSRGSQSLQIHDIRSKGETWHEFRVTYKRAWCGDDDVYFFY